VPNNDVLGANPDDLQHLATALRGAGGALDAADARLRQRLGAVSWAGGDAVELRRAWDLEVGGHSRRATVELRSVAEALEAQAIEQRQASGDVAAGPGERPGEVRSPVEPGAVPEDSTTAGGGPPPVTVLTETHTVGLEGGGSPVDGRAEATMRLTVADDGTAQVTVATDQRIGALAGEASAGVGVGLTGSRDLALSFADEATARRFISQMTDALIPDLDALAHVGAPNPLAVGLGLGVPALVLSGGKAVFDDVGRDAAGVLIANVPSDADHSVGGSVDVWAAGALDRFGVDAEIARGATYHPADGTWRTNTTIDASASAEVFGDLGVDLSAVSSVGTTIAPGGITEGRWSVEVTGGGAAALLSGLGVGAGGPGFDPGGVGVVRLSARLPATDAATREVLSQLNLATPAPHRVAGTLKSMIDHGELTLTVEHRDASDQGRSLGPVRVISKQERVVTEAAFRRLPGGAWTEVELPGR
jgi:hypothetical protein